MDQGIGILEKIARTNKPYNPPRPIQSTRIRHRCRISTSRETTTTKMFVFRLKFCPAPGQARSIDYNRSSCHVNSELTNPPVWPSWNTYHRGTLRTSRCCARAGDPLPSDDSTMQTGSSDSTSHNRNERKGRHGICCNTGKETPSRQVTERIVFHQTRATCPSRRPFSM